MKKEFIGYAAFDKESGKGLNVMFGFETRTSLTDDPDKVRIDESAKQVEMYAGWYNRTHKTPREFEVKKVVKVIEIKEVQDGE